MNLEIQDFGSTSQPLGPWLTSKTDPTSKIVVPCSIIPFVVPCSIIPFFLPFLNN